jgi:hypothetical protein
MALFSGFFSGNGGLGRLCARHLLLFALLFALLEIWRPYYFMTDDNLCGFFPYLTEMGRHLKDGRSPFVSDYLFGGHYLMLRDISFLYWHPFYVLPTFLADTPARFCIVEVIAGLLLLFGLAGFTLLAWRLREEWNPALPDSHLTFYTFSFFFSTFLLTSGASWINFLGSASALPWLMLGLLERRVFRALLLIALGTVHEITSGFLPLVLSIGLCLTVVAAAVAAHRRSPMPLLAWAAGNLLALCLLTPILARALDGAGRAARIGGLSLDDAAKFAMPARQFGFSLLAGNWTVPLAAWQGEAVLKSLAFPFLPTLLACAAAWCIFPAVINRAPWRFPDKLFLGACLFLAVFVIRPLWISAIMHQLPLVRSMRWPFREGLLLLFFLHLFFVTRPPSLVRGLQSGAMIVGLALFLLPLPFIAAPSFNPLAADRAAVFSGRAEIFWARVKARFAPGDQVVTIIPPALWQAEWPRIPYSYSGTACFPCLFQFITASGYSVSAPADQVPLRTIPYYWFGAFADGQVPELLAENPRLVIIRVETATPLKIAMTRDGVTTDLTPLLPP